jgi:RNA polymerase sigma factor (sigma-70 family)
MTEDVALAQEFERHRARLRAIAHRMLGSQAEADDAVQETWLRLGRTDAATIDNLGGWLTTVVSRVCLNALRARAARREDLVDQIPDPVVAPVDDPQHEAELADAVGIALLVVLETLSPSERVAFVLHDLFAVPFDDIAALLDRTPEAARQLASRARRRVRGGTARADADRGRRQEIVDAFLAAARWSTALPASSPSATAGRSRSLPSTSRATGSSRSTSSSTASGSRRST